MKEREKPSFGRSVFVTKCGCTSSRILMLPYESHIDLAVQGKKKPRRFVYMGVHNDVAIYEEA